MNGVLVVDKPKGYTSRDVVNIVSKKLKTKKVGHTGTLDPLATGVLVLCVGSYTKFVSKFTNHTKEYIATIQFGISTDTLDITGNVLEENPFVPSFETFSHVIKQFLGTQKQEVPIYSAKKVNGKKLYEYAREGRKISLPTQDIEIYSIEILHFEGNFATIRCFVSKGTYIRSLIRDICKACNCLGTMSDLRRTKLGNFTLSNAICLSKVEQKTSLLSFKDFLEYGTFEVTEREKNLIMHGNEIILDSADPYMLFTFQGIELALYERREKSYAPVFLLLK